MLLTVYIGNSNIVVGVFQEKALLLETRLKTDLMKTEYEYAVLLKEVLELYGQTAQALEGGVVASVVPQLTGVLSRAVRLLAKVQVLTVGPGVKTGLNIQIEDPGQLGANMVSTAIGVIEKYPLPAIIIDMDTATSFTLVDRERRLRGGAIAPGVITSLQALSGRTAQLPNISLDGEAKLVGANTVDCMRSGAVLGTACMIDGMLERFAGCFEEPPAVVACGWAAEKIIPHCRREIILDQGILLEGLCSIYYKNADSLKGHRKRK